MARGNHGNGTGAGADLAGRAFGRLTAVEWADPAWAGARCRAKWVCRCSCGETKAVVAFALTGGTTISCGCVVREGLRRNRGPMRTVIAKPQTITYQSWHGMIQRCVNPRSTGYRYYGGRGITVCPRWRESFAAFLEDVGERPSRGHSIDRIDVNGHYEPANCRWATAVTQMRNTSRNRLLTMNGETMPLSAWAERVGVSASTLWNRSADGWSDERVLTTPVGKYTRRAA